MMGITIKRNGSPESPTSEKKCAFLDNGFCKECNCSRCTGGVIINHETGRARECGCMTEARNIHRIAAAGLPDEYTFDSYKTTNEWQRIVKTKARAFVADKGGKWFFIGGQSGGGKTHICSAIVRELIRSGKSIQVFRWADMADRLKGYKNDSDRYDKELRKFLDADILFIDDLFKTKKEASDADIGLAMQIIDDRYNKHRVTIISTERMLDDIRRAHDFEGEAIASRIKERCGEYCFNIPRNPSKNYRFKE